ncbi:MAG: lysophospholipid acyltransferase family protein [Bacteriovoracaceae bacterium]
MLKRWLSKFSPGSTSEFDEIFEHLKTVYPSGEDAWGLNLKKAKKSMSYILPFYKNYFRVQVHGKENVRDETYMVVSNHSGQIAIDGMLITMAFAHDIFPPRVLRSMVERFFMKIPFVGAWASEGGAVLGDRQNCLNLLSRKQSILVFPEGVRGVAKSTSEYYELQKFTSGFYRLSSQAKVKILPVAVIGAEEFFPYVYQAKGLAKSLGLPALPISANYVPLPSPVDIWIGEPIEVDPTIDLDTPDEIINEQVAKVEDATKELIKNGLNHKRDLLSNIKGLLE